MRGVVSFFVVVLLAGSAFAKNLPGIDAFGARKGSARSQAELAQRVGNLARAGSRIQSEPRLGVPTFLWLSEAAQLSGRPQGQGAERREIAAARGHLSELAEVYNLAAGDVTNAVVDAVLNTGRGPVIVKFKQQLDGVEIFREELNLVMTQQLAPIAVTGYISSQNTPAAQPGQTGWTMSAARAAENALRDAAITNFPNAQLVKSHSRGGYDFYTLASPVAGVALQEPVRMKQVYFHMPEGLVPAYYIEVITSNVTEAPMIDAMIDESAYAYVLSAVDGSILFRKNLVDHATTPGQQQNALPAGGFTYRVWADPVTGIPYDSPAGNGVHPKLVPSNDGAQHSFAAPQDVTLPNFPFSQNDPWLAPGATETNGNNVDAFLNLFNPDGLGNPITTTPADPPNGDHRAQLSAPGQFVYNHQPDVDGASVTARSASIAQLFYNINFLHDWFYDAGFTEAMRNGQKDNYGRGGLAGDDIKGQVHDVAGFNNANMLTPADGSRPRMRMYNFTNLASHLEITAPAAIAARRSIGISMSGPQAFDVTSDIVIATFSNSPSSCTLTNAGALAGKIAMFDFDNTDATGCSFSTRISRITTGSTASAILMVYTSGAASSVANITGFVAANTTPMAVISWNSGAPIKTQLAGATPVSARLYRQTSRDGSLDNQIVAHEWGHYISNRLVANAAGLNNQQGGAMGEGWGDFVAMMLTVREDDVLNPSNANWNGVYAIATYATSGVPFSGSLNQGYYRGIRRGPYSTDMANYNALTFRHIMDGQALPTTIGFTPNTGVNSQVHNSGEVWSTMLWECYASLLRGYSSTWTTRPLPCVVTNSLMW